MAQTKLLFNEAVPVSTANRATRVDPPAALVIEKLLPPSAERKNVDGAESSLAFSALSEERLLAAVQLAKRDLRRRRFQSLSKSPPEPAGDVGFSETNDVVVLQELTTNLSNTKFTPSSPKEAARRGAKPSKVTCPGRHGSPEPRAGRSPPARDPGPRPAEAAGQPPLSKEIHKLQNELENYIRKVENLANGGEKADEPLDPEEQSRLESRRQKQAARWARGIYVLRQQVKEIEEDMEKLCSQNMWDAKKSSTVTRLAAAHRGTLRALRAGAQQLSGPPHGRIPPHYGELGRLIRQLSFCSARVQAERGSAAPEAALGILRRLETLDSAFSNQEMLQRLQARAHPPPQDASPPRASPARRPHGPPYLRGNTRGRRRRTTTVTTAAATSQRPKTTPEPQRRGELLRAGLQLLDQQRELKAFQKPGRRSAASRARAVRHGRSRAGPTAKEAGFQQPTVCSRLRVNQLPQKKHSVPWMPSSPRRPPPQRSPQRSAPEPRCLFSPAKPSADLPGPRRAEAAAPAPVLSSEKKKQAHGETLRMAWLDEMTTERPTEPRRPGGEDARQIPASRSGDGSPARWARRGRQETEEEAPPLWDDAQSGEPRNQTGSSAANRPPGETAAETALPGRADGPGEALLEDLSEESWQEADVRSERLAERRLRAPTLESMLLRMEEIQRDHDEVRRRFASIAYSDLLCVDPPGPSGPRGPVPASRPPSPRPIRLTMPALTWNSTADVLLENPVETGVLSESSAAEEDGRPAPSCVPFPSAAAQSGGRTVLSVPASMLRNLRRQRQDQDQDRDRDRDREARPGGFSPWAVAESLAEEFLQEALADVAAEFQGALEECAEAVFTSEFTAAGGSQASQAACTLGTLGTP